MILQVQRDHRDIFAIFHTRSSSSSWVTANNRWNRETKKPPTIDRSFHGRSTITRGIIRRPSCMNEEERGRGRPRGPKRRWNKKRKEEKKTRREEKKTRWRNNGKRRTLPNMVHKTIRNRAIVAHRDHPQLTADSAILIWPTYSQERERNVRRGKERKRRQREWEKKGRKRKKENR